MSSSPPGGSEEVSRGPASPSFDEPAADLLHTRLKTRLSAERIHQSPEPPPYGEGIEEPVNFADPPMDASADASSSSLLERFFNLSLDLFCIAGFDGYFKRLSRAWETTFGYSSEELTSRPFIEFVHPDDREVTLAEAAKLETGVDTISFSNRYRAKDGSYRWLEWSSTTLPDEQLLLAVARDVTAQRELQGELILLHRLTKILGEAEELDSALRETLTAISVSAGWSYAGAWVPSSDDHETLVSSPAWYAGLPGLKDFRQETENLRFHRGEGLVGSAWAEKRAIWSTQIRDKETPFRREAATRAGLQTGVAIPALDRGEVVAVLDFYLGEARQENQGFVDLVSSVATQLGQVILRRQIEQELSEMAERFREQALEDELTGLMNRRGFLTAAESRLALAKRTGNEVTILYLDIDGMKEINDRFGHAAGDQVLRETGRVLTAAVRLSDVVGRLGGDEFVVLLWGGSLAERESMKRIKHGLADRSDIAYPLSLSIGAAHFDPEESRSLDQLISEADRSMYQRKGTRSDAS